MQKLKFYTLLIGLALLLMQCNSKSYVTPTEKCSENDPFKNTIVESQYFEFSADEDNVKEGAKGTVIAFPKGCFVDKDGNVVKGAVKVELAEAFNMQDMINSNLTTASEGKSLETAGMVYFNVKTADGEQLGVNEDNPIYIEIPTDEREAGMQVYKGERDENGMTNWVAPEPIKSYLVTVDINLLNFLPEGFGETVERRIPFDGYTEATQALKDSLYYSLSGVSENDIYKRYEGADLDLNINEQHHYNNTSPTGSLVPSNHYDPNDYKAVLIQDPGYDYDGMPCGIDPAIIKTIKNEKFAKSYIATRAFEARLKVIFKTCRDDVLELYIKNLEKDLWKVDELAAELLKGYPETDMLYQEPDLNCVECDFEEQFLKFAAQKLTNVEDAGKQAELLKDYYNKKIKTVQDDINAANAELKKTMDAENEAAKGKVEEYKDLLWEREKYRMETYGFEFESTGWVNVDKPMPEREVVARVNEPTESCSIINQLDVKLAEGKSYERAYVYLVYSDIQSMRRLDTDDQELFMAKHNSRQGMVIYGQTPAILVGVAYNGETPYIGVKKFVTTADKECNQHLDITLVETTVEQLNKTLGGYDSYSPANRISKDLEYQAAFAVEKKRQEKLADERRFLLNLWECANYCCRDYGHG
ncbi:MAG: hypothetical protein GY810_21340 [Aureispira sp.]|nr:hypothetical protein [Aureispira sp.]